MSDDRTAAIASAAIVVFLLLAGAIVYKVCWRRRQKHKHQVTLGGGNTPDAAQQVGPSTRGDKPAVKNELVVELHKLYC